MKITGRANIKPGFAMIEQRTTIKILASYLPRQLYALSGCFGSYLIGSTNDGQHAAVQPHDGRSPFMRTRAG
jgi:hypothetical protein